MEPQGRSAAAGEGRWRPLRQARPDNWRADQGRSPTTQKTAPQLSKAQTLAAGPPRKTHVLIRGDFLRPGVEVQPGTPAVLPPLPKRRPQADPPRPGRAGSSIPANPLTARVTVNWVWQQVFRPRPGRDAGGLRHPGRAAVAPGIARLAGDASSSASGWSLKALHRLIVTSATYRQSSHVPAGAGEPRPAQRAAGPAEPAAAGGGSRPRRAPGRRAACWPRTVGGPSVRPPQPAGISELTYAGSAKLGREHRRRPLPPRPVHLVPAHQPVPDADDVRRAGLATSACVRRERSNTPLQALTLLNDPVFVECASRVGTAGFGGQAGRAGLQPGALRRPPVPGPRALPPAERERLLRLFDDSAEAARPRNRTTRRSCSAARSRPASNRQRRPRGSHWPGRC